MAAETIIGSVVIRRSDAPDAPYFVTFEPKVASDHPPCKPGQDYCFARSLSHEELLEFPNARTWLKTYSPPGPDTFHCRLPVSLHHRYV